MKLYIESLIPRLRGFSENLDRKEIFVDIPWVVVDEDSNQQKYIFKRNGELVMSLNGQVTIGKWEYLSTAKVLLIDRIQDKILLNQNFIDPAVMVLKKDGTKDGNLFLANEILLPDLNIAGYLKELFYQKNYIRVKKLTSGEFVEIDLYDKVSIEGEPISDGFIELADSENKYVIQDSKIFKILSKVEHNTNMGKIVVEQNVYTKMAIGDFVFKENLPAPDGKYRIGFMNHIWVENGRISRT